jgi:hypothetical protein
MIIIRMTNRIQKSLGPYLQPQIYFLHENGEGAGTVFT